MTDRAVSDTVGFVLVFGLITTVVAISLTSGIGGLESTQQVEQDNNVERAFDVLHDNLKDIHQDGVPSRTTEVSLLDSQLAHDESRFSVNASGEEIVDNRSMTSIVHTGTTDTSITYEGGAVIRSDGDSNVMVRQPPMVTNDREAIIPFIRTFERGPSYVTGDSTVLIAAEKLDRSSIHESLTAEGEGEDIEIEITVHSERADAWERYFKQRDHIDEDEVELDDGYVTATIKAEEEYELYVYWTEMTVEFRS